MRLPDLPALPQYLHELEDRPEELVQVGEALHLERPAAKHLVLVFAAHHALRQEIDEGVRLGVDVVAVEQTSA